VPNVSKPESLASLLSVTHHNILVSRRQFPVLFEKLERIHETFVKFIAQLSSIDSPLARYFLLRTHSSFIAGATLATSTQIADSFAVCRLVLENAIYAFYISRHPDLSDIWLNRQDSEQTRKRSRETFRTGDMISELENEDPDIGRFFRLLYGDVIDFGAHPNVASILPHTDHIDTPEETVIRHHYFSTNLTNIEYVIRTLARCGALSIDIFLFIWRDDEAIRSLQSIVAYVKADL
jgi:hypothetical protein